eukprot:TRINITY_DN3492_c0_g1_i1.p1 TRINITY_DN3492_c0_g1~~TRINITY_DN3492_c0_g1_i1.p1  ORF type:complete len:304 (+),score=47.48 TRINITY_DN3492_c0_g1_i1:1-912(+)
MLLKSVTLRNRSARLYSTLRPRRVLFNIPGSDERKIKKGFQLNLDCAVLDFEDGVALSEKEKARNLVKDVLMTGDFGRAERCVRINSSTSEHYSADLNALIPVINKLDAIVLPKVENSKQIENVHQFLLQHDVDSRIKILAAVESAIGIVNLKEICTAPRVEALIFASEDYCADIGATRTSEGTELLYARTALVTYAAAFNLQAIDMVCIDFKNEQQLIKECIQGFNMGYTGKQAIHPSQVETIYNNFRPPPEKIDFAKRVIVEFEKHQKEGRGAFQLDGKMVDMPLVIQARRLLEKSNETIQ